MIKMFFVTKNNIDKNGCYVSGEIVSHTTGATPENILENAVMSFVAFEGGQKMVENIKIIDVHSLNQVAEPLIDTMLLYRVITEPNQIHVYQRVSKQVPGYVFGQTVVPEFTRIKIFELMKYGTEIEIPVVEMTEIVVLSAEPEKTIIETETQQIPFFDAEIAKETQLVGVSEQVESTSKNQETLTRSVDLVASLESSPKFLRMKEKND